MKTAGNLVETRFWELADGTKENPIGSFLHPEFHSRFPSAGSPDVLGHDNLSLGGEPSDVHK
jgi:hypothetical protein